MTIGKTFVAEVIRTNQEAILRLALRTVQQKTSVALLRLVLDVVERFGRPQTVRTDNESCFTSWLFRFGLTLLGIRHQRSALMAPWQNGRIERFFGTFKAACRQLEGLGPRGHELSQSALDDFRAWYNHLRPHQHLDGRTPAQAWAGVQVKRRKKHSSKLIELWNGVLDGYLFPS